MTGLPRQPEEFCLLARYDDGPVVLSDEAHQFVTQARRRLGYVTSVEYVPDRKSDSDSLWYDLLATDEQVIEVLTDAVEMVM